MTFETRHETCPNDRVNDFTGHSLKHGVGRSWYISDAVFASAWEPSFVFGISIEEAWHTPSFMAHEQSRTQGTHAVDTQHQF